MNEGLTSLDFSIIKLLKLENLNKVMADTFIQQLSKEGRDFINKSLHPNIKRNIEPYKKEIKLDV